MNCCRRLDRHWTRNRPFEDIAQIGVSALGTFYNLGPVHSIKMDGAIMLVHLMQMTACLDVGFRDRFFRIQSKQKNRMFKRHVFFRRSECRMARVRSVL